MTNFEKWQEGLNPEKLLDCLLDSVVSRCLPCPARDECVHNKQARGCNSAFLAWANSPAKEEKPVQEPKSKFPISHPLHMSTEEMKAADTALFTQTGGRMGKDWRNAEEAHHGVIAKPGKDGEIDFCWCQKCYGQADVVHDPFGDGEKWSYCKKCGVSFRLKRGEGR